MSTPQEKPASPTLNGGSPDKCRLLAFLESRWRWLLPLTFLAATTLVLASMTCSYIKVAVGWPSETRNVWQYEQIRGIFSRKMVQHFPESIPYDASGTRLYYTPGFLQAGTDFQVSFRLPADRIEQLFVESAYRTKGRDVSGYPAPRYRFAGTDTEFPPDFQIFILDGKSSGTHNWNHGFMHGLAISKRRNEVVYWTEIW